MIKLIVARGPDDRFEHYLRASLRSYPDLPVFFIENEDDEDSIFRKYNRGIALAAAADDDILAFIHADVRLVDDAWMEKVERIFKDRPQVGMVGAVGTSRFENGAWWLTPTKYHRGHWNQVVTDETGDTIKYLHRRTMYAEDLVAVDGFCFFVRGSVAKSIPFDEKTYPRSYHYYDIDYSLSVLEAGWLIGVQDVLMEHASRGQMGDDWMKNQMKFQKKWALKGYRFPLELNQFRARLGKRHEK